MKTIRKGDSGPEVTLLCKELKRLGYSIVEKQMFDEELHQLVLKFQEDNALGADGIVGYNCWERALFNKRSGGEKLTEDDFNRIAQLLDCEVAAIKAVQKVETGGRGGFFAPGKPAILFEGHVFWQQLKKRGINPENFRNGHEHILYPKWEKGHYKGGIGEYVRLEAARKIHREAADASASWGMFQIMGFNYEACGEKSVASFVASMCESECKQLLLSARFIRRSGILPALKAKNWTEFAKKYNGPAYVENLYDKKLADAYRSYSI